MSKIKDLTQGGIADSNAQIQGSDNVSEIIASIGRLPEVIAKPASPLAAIMNSIAALPQVERLVLYGRLDMIMNYDREKASTGVDNCAHLFDEAIKSL